MFIGVWLSLFPLLTFVPAAPSYARTATPQEYGFPVPRPSPALPSDVDTFKPPLLRGTAGPAVAEFTRTGGPGEILTLAGPDFSSSTSFLFFGQTTGKDAAMLERRPHFADGIAASVILPDRLPSWSTYLVWPKDKEGYGRPVAVNRTEAWWIGSDQALSGDTVSVFGRNLSRQNGTSSSHVYVKPRGGRTGRWVKPTTVNPYRVSFKIPALTSGPYEVWTHNGHSGEFGWSGPLTLTILPRSPFAGQSRRRFSVKEYGATGDGSTDDTAAIQRALSAAGEAAPASVYFPAGTYLVNDMLEPRDNVSWLGDSRDTSILKVGPRFNPPAWGAFIFSDSDTVHRVRFKNLSFIGNGNLRGRKLFQFRQHKYVQIRNSRFHWKGTVGGFSIDADYLTLSNNEFIGDQVFLGSSRQVTVNKNDFRLTDMGHAAIISWGGSEVALTQNRARDYDPAPASIGDASAGRFFVSQSHPDSNRHFYIAENVTHNMAPPVNVGDANQGEQILFEVGTSAMAARPTAVTPTTVTFPGAPPSVRSQDAVILQGRGAGQFRRVMAVKGTTVTVSPAWSVLPDSTSLIGLGPAQTRTVVYRNRLDGKGDYATYQTASVGLNMYGNVSDVIFVHNTVTRMRGGLVVEFSQVPNPNTPTPSASYFNLIAHNSLNGAQTGVGIATNFLARDAPGTIGHLGNTYRWNTMRNIASRGIALYSDQGGYTGGDLHQVTFEHNTITGVPTLLWAGRDTQSNKPMVTRFRNLQFYGNTFERGTSAVTGSKALELSGVTPTLWSAANKWIGFRNPLPDGSIPPVMTKQSP